MDSNKHAKCWACGKDTIRLHTQTHYNPTKGVLGTICNKCVGLAFELAYGNKDEAKRIAATQEPLQLNELPKCHGKPESACSLLNCKYVESCRDSVASKLNPAHTLVFARDYIWHQKRALKLCEEIRGRVDTNDIYDNETLFELINELKIRVACIKSCRQNKKQ